MAEDKFNFRVNSWWNTLSTPGTPVNPLAGLLNALNSSIGSVAGNHASPFQLSSAGILSPGITSFLTSQSGYTATIPEAFVN